MCAHEPRRPSDPWPHALRSPAWWRRLTERLARGQEGFTIVEMVFAVAVFAIVIGGVVAGMGSSLNLTRQNRHRAVAANLAAQEMDIVRSTQFTSLPVGTTTTTQTVDGTTFTITRDSRWVTASSTSGPCQSPAGSKVAFLQITESVTWPNMRGVAPVTSQTVVTPPVGAYDPSLGHIAVSVYDRNGAAVSGATVSLTGPQTASKTTDADGCAFFPYMSPGAYTATVSKPAYVSDQGVASPSQPVTVTGGTLASLQFLYDLAATLNVTMVGLGGTAQNPAVVPATLPIALGNTSLLPTGVKIVGGTANPQAVGSLFPYASGYQVWAGNCNDADPEGVNASGTRYWPTSSRPTPTNVTPGATTNVTLSLRSVNVLVRRSNGSGGFTNVAGATVVAQHAVAPGCSAVQSYTLGVTASNGRIISGLPYGTWTIIANSTSGGTVSISPTGTSAVGKTVTVP